MEVITTTEPPSGTGAYNYTGAYNFTNTTGTTLDGYTVEYDYYSPEDLLASQQFEQRVRICVAILFTLIVLVGFVGNLLVIIVVFSNKKMQNTTNILIVSLAVADLSFIVFCVPFTAANYTMTQWPFGNVWCKIVNYLMYVCAYASVYTLVLMSLDRYLAVVHPITSMRIRNSRNAYIIVYLTWIIILGGNVPVIFEFDHIPYPYIANSTRSVCTFIDFFKENYQAARPFYGSFFAFGYVIPLALNCILYGFMIKRLLYGVVPGGSQRVENMRSKKRVTKMVVIVVVIFALCWLPIQIVFIAQTFFTFPQTHVAFAIQLAANCLAYMNSCVNPVLYAFLSENFRRSFKKLLCCTDDPLNKFDYERTNIRGLEKESKDTLLNNKATTTNYNTDVKDEKDRNSNTSENNTSNTTVVLPMQTFNNIETDTSEQKITDNGVEK